MTHTIVVGRLMHEAGGQCVQDAQLVYAAASIHSSRTPKR